MGWLDVLEGIPLVGGQIHGLRENIHQGNWLGAAGEGLTLGAMALPFAEIGAGLPGLLRAGAREQMAARLGQLGTEELGAQGLYGKGPLAPKEVSSVLRSLTGADQVMEARNFAEWQHGAAEHYTPDRIYKYLKGAGMGEASAVENASAMSNWDPAEVHGKLTQLGIKTGHPDYSFNLEGLRPGNPMTPRDRALLALHGFTKGNFSPLQSAMGDPFKMRQMLDESLGSSLAVPIGVGPRVKLLDQLMSYAPPSQVPLYRALQHSPEPIEQGIFRARAASFSEDPHAAWVVGGQHGSAYDAFKYPQLATHIIEAPVGTRALPISRVSEFPGESEYLVNMAARLRNLGPTRIWGGLPGIGEGGSLMQADTLSDLAHSLPAIHWQAQPL